MINYDKLGVCDWINYGLRYSRYTVSIEVVANSAVCGLVQTVFFAQNELRRALGWGGVG